ncbi:MAG TPA: sensor histidine kinase, partial [Maritimibacter sp.]|nr:sensor histidine kinase [Maritimibacter sp.]
SVQDEGIGIPENSSARVFGKFSQVDSSDIRKVGGTGLGLNITKQIVERHEGTIDYESEHGVGSTFYVEFDRVMEAETTDKGSKYVTAAE